MAWLFLIILTFFVCSYLYLRGENLSHLDTDVIPYPAGEPSEEHHAVVASLADMSVPAHSMTRSDGIASIREKIDAVSDGRVFSSEFRTVDEGGIKGEWVIAPGANPRRRLLYIHGGAWLAGSPKSHRTITDKLSGLADAAVFSLDYRLLPENSRREGIEDCRQAYHWILANGPDGELALDFFVIAGDSAGGNLTLSLIAWARDQQLRAADAAIAFSPATDMTLTSPSLAANVGSDPMLGPAFGKLLGLPRVLLWWMSWYTNRIRPSETIVSPLRGDLSGLPPVLVQVSEAEMLYDDARRYVKRAQAAGSPVVLQSWPHMVHVWQIFTPELPEADHAYDNIAEFLVSVEGGVEDAEAA
jgi:monoterpene epsilon-lactone hydrolase